MPTGARGEGYLELDGQRHEILFTNRALADAERLTEKSVMQFLRDAGMVSISDLVQYVAVGLRYAQRDSGPSRRGGFDIDTAWQLLDGLGMTAVAKVVLDALADVISYQMGDAGSPPE
ncbi:hypothetical protein KKF82_06690 [Patescibacteria group bacterium]|nr:hypothetical protein [Patescibacteria group bacterium]